MHLEIKNEQLAGIKQFVVIFSLLPIALLFVAFFYYPEHKILDLFLYLSIFIIVLVIYLYSKLSALPAYFMKSSGGVFLIPDASFLKWDKSHLSVNREDVKSIFVECGIDDCSLILKVKNIPDLVSKNMIMGHIKVLDEVTILFSFPSEKLANKARDKLLKHMNA